GNTAAIKATLNVEKPLLVTTGSTNLVVDDSADPGAKNVTVTEFDVSGLSPANITYNPKDLASLTLKSGSGNDTFTIVNFPPPSSIPFPITIDAGAGTNTLIGPNIPTTFRITGANAGKVVTVSFSNFQNLVGGSANATFAFKTGGSLSGSLNGGGGTNRLNYSAFTGDVVVDLPLGTATGVAGGISNIK